MFVDKDISKFNNIETPFYYYDTDLLQKTLRTCAEAAAPYHFHIHYALKANFNAVLLEEIKGIGFGADCVSAGEVRRAVEVGFDHQKIVFTATQSRF